jgi:hypothetical protein
VLKFVESRLRYASVLYVISPLWTDNYSGQKRRDVGSIFCRKSSTSSSSTTSGKLAFLNNMVGIFEYEADEIGNSEGKIWEWK